jgi:hypothetical protein
MAERDSIAIGERDDKQSSVFWEQRTFLILVVVATAVPLLWPAMPPLTDLPGHVASYHVAQALHSSPDLQRYYDFHWQLAGNLGVDLAAIPMAKLFGLELGTKLIVIAIPMLLAAGFLGVARELHGRIPPTAFFALPLTYHYAFQFGFLNFSLSAAFCFLGFWLWLGLGRRGKHRLRAAIFLPLACMIWVTHAYGWGMLGILVFAAQSVERRQEGAGWPKALMVGAFDCAPLALPFLLMAIWRSGNLDNQIIDFFDWDRKQEWLVSFLRERWKLWDLASALLLLGLTVVGMIGWPVRSEPRTRLAALLLVPIFVFTPTVLLGSGYADMRLVAFIVAIVVLGLKPVRSPTMANGLAAAALLFVTARLAVTTLAFVQLDRSWQDQLEAIDHIARGSRVLVLTDVLCDDPQWADNRLDHVSSVAVTRKDVFTNGQWVIRGALGLDVRYRAGAPFVMDPSHLMRRPPCPDRKTMIPAAARIAPGRFDYLWLVGAPPSAWPRSPGLMPVWHGAQGLLLRRTSETSTSAAVAR